MAQVFKSGAFLQQCWSVHPLCLAVKRVVEGRTVILGCSSCRSVHHLTLATVKLGAGAASPGTEEPAGSADPGRDRARLIDCVDRHAATLTLREMDVFEDQVIIRCAECRRHYVLSVASFETHQK
ncbi:MAG TPA: hypothetical protein VFS39_07640 [Nitrospira sp.]|nr:hypothetical protein [Nitrospira sp.]